MKQGQTLAELAQTLQEQRAMRHDLIADTRDLTMLNGTELSIAGHGEFAVNDLAHRQIGDRLKVPAKFYDRLRHEHPALLDHNANYLFRNEPERRMVRTFKAQDGTTQTARAFLSDRYRRIDNAELVEAVLPMLEMIPDYEVKSCAITDTRLYLKVVAPRTEAEVAVGDVVTSGVVISNSEVGKGALNVQAMIYRLVCMNGMIAGNTMRAFHLGAHTDERDGIAYRDETVQADDRALMLKLQDAVRTATSEVEFMRIVDQMREATQGERITKPKQAVEIVADKFALNDGEQESVLLHLAQGGDMSRYGMLNAITRASQDVSSYERATELEAVGARVLDMHKQEWDRVAIPA
jgi:hypothetical protein